MNGRTSKPESRPAAHRLTAIEEEVVVHYILDLDTRGFPPQHTAIEDIANLLLAQRDGGCVGKHWAEKFVKRQPKLKTRFNRAYDFQRALYEDPELISAWFKFVYNMRAKYSIYDYDFYNFDETGFIIGVIYIAIVVTYVD